MYIYLVLSKTGTWLSRVLRLFVKSKYVHASISMDEKFDTMYSFGRVNPDNPFSGGFAQESFWRGVYKKHKDCECIIYRIKITKEQYDILAEEISKFLASRESFKYNFLGLIAAGLNIPLKRKRYYFCTQFVSELLIKINVLDNFNTPELIKPTDLMEIETKEEIFKGFVREFVPNQ